MFRYTPMFSLILLLTACTDSSPSDNRNPGFFINSARDLYVERNATANLEVTVDRYGGFDGAVKVSASNLPNNVDVEPIVIPSNKVLGVLVFKVQEFVGGDEAVVQLNAISVGQSVQEHSSLPLTVRGVDNGKPVPLGQKFLDTNFGEDGIAITAFSGNDAAYALAIDASGKIMAAGGTFTPPKDETSEGDEDFAIARYNMDGSLDTSFGEDGKVTTDFGGSESANAIAIAENSKIVVAGDANFGIGSVLARYNTDGTLDNSFGDEG